MSRERGPNIEYTTADDYPELADNPNGFIRQSGNAYVPLPSVGVCHNTKRMVRGEETTVLPRSFSTNPHADRAREEALQRRIRELASRKT